MSFGSLDSALSLLALQLRAKSLAFSKLSYDFPRIPTFFTHNLRITRFQVDRFCIFDNLDFS